MPTLTSTRRREPGAPKTEAQLFVALESERPLAGSSRYRIRDLDVVTLHRGERRDAVVNGRTLAVSLPDGRMSSKHARLACVGGAWLIEDQGSKNGTLVNGLPIQRAELEDGDVIELGHTLLLYRRVPLGEPGPLATELSPGAGQRPRTLSTSFEGALERLERVAASGVTVLVRGESGSGKELIARLVHERSGRRGAFVGVNCGALVETLMQSELFGHRKGAFSGADADYPGLVRSADGGTLFLDEIGDLPPASQAALLRVLQEREVKPVGAVQPVSVDLRVASATHRDLERMMAEGEFRADLYARLAGFELVLPPLRERPEDIGVLIAELLLRHGASGSATLECEAARALLSHDWPLNVRELEQCVASAIVLAGGSPIALEHLPGPVRAALAGDEGSGNERVVASPLSVEEEELRQTLVDQLTRHSGNVSAVARELGKDRKQIHRWMRRFRILKDR